MHDFYSSQKGVTGWDVAEEDLPNKVLTAQAANRLFLLPDKTIDGVGIYRDDVAGLVKTLRHHGVDIDFALAREDRRYLSEYSAVEIVAAIGLAVAGTLTSDLVKSISLTVWQRARSALGVGSAREEVDAANVAVRIAEIVRNDQETVIRGLEVTGPVAEIESLICQAISDRQPPQLPPEVSDSTGPEDESE
ncbi:hypothetical protein [Streptomyces sp. NPDC057794]|uniref:hypothetical protein n=1 Tax=Streptomyces sp. NPDC057794 TaxID=3346251 RepID=UPI0036890330